MKKILHISKYYYPFRGGTEQIAQDCVKSLIGLYDQKVICFNHEKEDKVDKVDGIDIIRCGTFVKISSQSLSLTYGRNLKQTIDTYKPDLIIFHYPNPFVLMFLLKYIPNSCKLITYWHLDIIKQKILKNFFILQNKKLLKRSDVIWATSPLYIEGSANLSKYKDKCVVVPNCINESRLIIDEESKKLANQIKNENKDKIICLAVGRHTKYKGFDYLIKAAHKLDDRFSIYITGEGEETKKLKLEAANDDKIHFIGIVDDTVLKAYLIAMDIFCFPSITKNEAFGLALAEGMYFGKPAVTFTIPGSGVNYVCLNGENGIEVPNKDIDAYSKALISLSENPKMRKEMGENARKRVIDNFLYNEYTKKVRSEIDKVVL